jgi:rhamnosyltransferase subunit B
MSSRIVICANGTLGDFYPYLAIALELKVRGHSVVLATGRLYQSKVEIQDVEFYPIQPDLSSYTPAVLKEEIGKMMDSARGGEYVIRQLLMPHVRASYDAMMDVVRGADLLLTHPLFFAGPLVAEKTGIRWVSTVLAPISIPSIYDPAVLNIDSLIQPEILKPWLANLLQKLGRWHLRPWSEPIRQLRTELGLSVGDDPLIEGQFSPHLVLALFSQVLAVPQPDWPSMLFIPYAHDQPDNATRAKRLGVARILSRRRYTASRVAAELSQLLNDRHYSSRANEISLQVKAETGVQTACDAIEAQLAVRSNVLL